MEAFEIRCEECQARLKVQQAHVGKRIRCTQCQHVQVVPNLTPIEPKLPPLPPLPPLPKSAPAKPAPRREIPCDCCGHLLTDTEAAAGKYCAACRGEAPEREVESYSIGSSVAQAPRVDFGATLEEWWPTGEGTRVPYSWRAVFQASRENALDGQWKAALKLLHPLFRDAVKEKIPDADQLNRPLAFCLSRWSRRELREFQKMDKKPTNKLVTFLNLVVEAQKWGRTFDNFECPICERSRRSKDVGVRIRTTRGSVYTCCVPINTMDDKIVQHLRTIREKIDLASYLDAEVTVAESIYEKLPAWFRVVKFQGSYWITRVYNELPSNEGDGGDGISSDAGAAGMFAMIMG